MALAGGKVKGPGGGLARVRRVRPGGGSSFNGRFVTPGIG